MISSSEAAQCSVCEIPSIVITFTNPGYILNSKTIGNNWYLSKLTIKEVSLEYVDEDTIKIYGTCYTESSDYCVWTMAYYIDGVRTGGIFSASGLSDARQTFSFSRTIDLEIGKSYSITLGK